MKKIFLFSMLIFLSASTMWAQPINKQTREMKIEIADEQVEALNYYGALEWYEKVIEEDKKDKKKADIHLNYKIANLHYLLRDYKRAERYYKKVVNARMKKGKVNPYLPEARFIYGRVLKMNEEYEDAMGELEDYIMESKDEVNKKLAKAELDGARMAMGMTPVTGVFFENAGKANTRTTESSPYLADDGTLYFASFLTNEVIVKDEKDGDARLRIVTSTRKEKKKGRGKKKKVEKGEYEKGKPLTTKINREGYHTGSPSFSEDGSIMFFTRMELDGNTLSSSKVYFSEKDGKRWKGAQEVAGINGDYLVKHPTVGEHFGEEVLFFSSDMPGGTGGFDIYYATKKGDGVYADPKNIGETINTVGDDETPFYKDGTMYFSSTGHPGIGGYDIFSSQWDGSNWSKPANLGKGYNSPVDDLFFMLDGSGNNGVILSNRVGTKSQKSKTCCDDIFTVTIPDVILELVATTFDDKDQPLNGVTVSLIEVVDNERGDTDAQTNGNANNFGFTLKEEKSYMVIGKAEGFFPDTAYLNTVGLTESTVIDRQLKLAPVPPPEIVETEITVVREEPIELKNILFEFDDDEILPEAEPDLQLVLDLMNTYSDMVIELGSHTDAQGNDSYNQRLSQRRAASSKRWLTERGIADSRVKAVGYGETQIRNHCVNGVKCPDEEHRYNRRTEFKIISGPTTIKIEEKRLQKSSGNGGIGMSQQSGKKKFELTFEKDMIDLGTLTQGDKRQLKFKFTNTGTEEVKIDFAQGSCGCTVPDWPRKNFKPGESGEIEVEYNSKEKEGAQDNSVDVILTATDEKGYPIIYTATFKAFVKTK
ncbi:MAG: DUF1573 domain-containing protein [Bacteroidota bacterium]